MGQSQRWFESLERQGKLDARIAWDKIAIGEFREKAVTATFGALADVHCHSVLIQNPTAKVVGIRRGGTGVVLKLPAGSSQIIDVPDNANQLQIQNNTDNTSITVQYQCLGENV